MDIVVSIRFAREDDLRWIRRVEEASDHGFVNWALSAEGRGCVTLGDPAAFGGVPSGEERAREPGFLLVAIDEDEGGRVVGFAHVLEHEGGAHLEQVSVVPESQRRGIGRALTEAACREASVRGHRVIRLRTFADVPFNGPFYRSMGFVESEPDTEWLRSLREAEDADGWGAMGRRIQMTRVLPGA